MTVHGSEYESSWMSVLLCRRARGTLDHAAVAEQITPMIERILPSAYAWPVSHSTDVAAEITHRPSDIQSGLG